MSHSIVVKWIPGWPGRKARPVGMVLGKQFARILHLGGMDREAAVSMT